MNIVRNLFTAAQTILGSWLYIHILKGIVLSLMRDTKRSNDKSDMGGMVIGGMAFVYFLYFTARIYFYVGG